MVEGGLAGDFAVGGIEPRRDGNNEVSDFDQDTLERVALAVLKHESAETLGRLGITALTWMR